MILFDVFFAFLTAYLFIYCIYQLFFFVKANDIEKYFEMHEKTRNIVMDKKKLCVLIYASQECRNLDSLLGILNNQSYGKEYYEVHVAYKRDESDTTTERDFALGARIHNIQNPDYFSKDKAVNLLVRRMLTESKFDAFIFLNADRTVGERYLENINKSLSESGVLVGSKVCINERNQLSKIIKNSIITAYLKYVNRTNSIARAMFNLPFIIDGGNLVITTDILEKMGYVGIEDKDSELEYSLDLASNDIKSMYCPYIISAVDIKNYDFSSPSFKNKLALFSHYFFLLAFKSNSFKEFILFLIKPNSLFVLFGFILLVWASIYMPEHVAQKAVSVLGAFLFINFIISVKISKIRFSEIFWLLFYPICLSWHKLIIFMGNINQNSIREARYDEENVNSATISATAINNKKDFTCKLDLVSEDGMRKVVYREGNKFIVTDSFLRMHDALEDITYKLKSKGITLKICQNCRNFTLCPDGTLDCLNGKCNISQSEILVWNGCQYFALNGAEEEE